ncbi:endonuclease/exonuclease/phosphatase family protein [Pontiella sp.]|uniref:endonuclease/exonuclease/phosphatase family protein n=1 Tax=Pontiella sp. TaxID=2837462 RepID=UPI003564A5E0
MKFMLYNICYATHGNQKKLPLLGLLGRTHGHLDELIGFIGDIDPDVIGLIEVDGGSYRAGRKSQVEMIAEKLGHFHSYRSKYGSDSRWQRIPIYNKQGNAFLAKDTIHSEKFHYFERGMKKLVLELELEKVTFFLVHLALSYKARQAQILHLYHMIKETDRPYIVAGDFNAFAGEDEIQLLMSASGLRNADPTLQPSYPSKKPRKQLDFILHSPKIKINRFEMPQVQLSDHLPLVVDFDILEPVAS